MQLGLGKEMDIIGQHGTWYIKFAPPPSKSDASKSEAKLTDCSPGGRCLTKVRYLVISRYFPLKDR